MKTLILQGQAVAKRAVSCTLLWDVRLPLLTRTCWSGSKNISGPHGNLEQPTPP